MNRADEVERCEYLYVHQDVVEKVTSEMPKDETLYDLAELFKVFGDSTRIKILYALFEAELCVCDIAQLLGLTPAAVSHQLRVLKTSKLVKNRRDGKMFFILWQTTMCAGLLTRVWNISTNKTTVDFRRVFS